MYNGQGELAFSHCRSGKRFNFSSSEKYLKFLVYIYNLSFSMLYLQLCNLINPRKILNFCVVYSA